MKHLIKHGIIAGMATVVALCPLVSLAVPPHKTPPGHQMKQQHSDKDWKSNKQNSNTDKVAAQLAFNASHRALLHDLVYSKDKHKDLLDPSTRKIIFSQSDLPPGIRKQLARGKGLPPGLRDKVVLLPYDVNDYLGFRGRRDVQVGVLGRDIILYSVATGLVLDILQNVLD